MKLRKKLILWMMVGVIVLCVAVPIVLIRQQLHQNSLDYALIQAVEKLDALAVTRLLEEGANANARNDGKPPLTLSSLLKRLWDRLKHPFVNKFDPGVSVLQFLMKYAGDFQAQDVERADQIAASLIQHGASIHSRGRRGEPLLNMAAQFGMHQTLALLVSYGRNVNAQDEDGSTPLMRADAYATNLLIQHGADVNARDAFQRTALFYAEDVEVVKLLIRYGVNVNAVDADGMSALGYVQMSFLRDRAEILRLLNQHGARLNQKDKEALKQARP